MMAAVAGTHKYSAPFSFGFHPTKEIVTADSQSMDIKAEVRKFTWKIENFSDIQEKRLYSNSFAVGGILWRLIIYPKGYTVKNIVDHISIFVEVADSASLGEGWSIYAQFRLAVVDQIDGKSSIAKVGKHEFNAGKGSGFPSILPHSKLYDLQRGYLVNNACLVVAHICTDRTIDLESLELMVKSNEADCGKAAIDNQKPLVIKPEEITTPSQSILAAPAVLSSPAQDEEKSTNQNLATDRSSAQSEAAECEDPTDEDMDSFFSSLESELASSNTVSSQEKAKEALAKVEEALNMAPANFHGSGEFSALSQAFKILSSFDCSSTLAIEQKNELLAMEENFKQLSEQAAKAVRDRNLLTEKESVKLTLTRNLEDNLIKFKEAKAEVKQIEQKIAALLQQVDEAQKNRENMLAERKHVFRISKELKMELEALGRQWPEYEAKAKVAEEEEKAVEAEWSRMKDFISSIKGKI